MSQTKHKGDFYECASCRVKPGSPTLCESCLHNREVIQRLRARSQPNYNYWNGVTGREKPETD